MKQEIVMMISTGESTSSNKAHRARGARWLIGFAQDISGEAQNTMLVSTDEPGDLCEVVTRKTFRGITVSDCELTAVTLSLEEIKLRTYKLTLSPDANWWRSMQLLLGLNRYVSKCRYNGHPTK
ncbi:hypothetical protein CRM22_010831 [Opisthorchis felineus]|uniref:Uncharacterized protein n=1 Tax=Opisthorchis felineus TaxID=147828 RepID=A0A4S2KQS9_OPIFE|nr:hypothetical protein CRM22_010831 [Opisthorchis felineus]